MNRPGLSKDVIKIRMIGAPQALADLAQDVVSLLEEDGYKVIEWSNPTPCREPDQDKDRIYISAIKKGETDGNNI